MTRTDDETRRQILDVAVRVEAVQGELGELTEVCDRLAAAGDELRDIRGLSHTHATGVRVAGIDLGLISKQLRGIATTDVAAIAGRLRTTLGG